MARPAAAAAETQWLPGSGARLKAQRRRHSNDDDGAGDRLAVRGAGIVDDGVNVRGGGGLLLDAGRCGEVPDLVKHRRGR